MTFPVCGHLEFTSNIFKYILVGIKVCGGVRKSDPEDDDIQGHINGWGLFSRSRCWVMNQAIERFLGYSGWFVHEVKVGLGEAKKEKSASMGNSLRISASGAHGSYVSRALQNLDDAL